jgi:acyl-coenzyme A thioesterase PaaI-like protein
MGLFSKNFKATMGLRLFGIKKVPLIWYVRPTVEEVTQETISIKIPLKRRNKNHLNSLYFGVLAVGADCAAGILAMNCIEKSGYDVSLVFKDFRANFLKRAEGDTIFTSNAGKEVTELVEKAIETGERVEMPVEVIATVPDKLGDEPVAEFVLTLSLKRRN